jgi:hypothetical protein
VLQYLFAHCSAAVLLLFRTSFNQDSFFLADGTYKYCLSVLEFINIKIVVSASGKNHPWDGVERAETIS